MADTLLELAYRLTQAGEPFVVATVVWCERPTSAKPGARAIIQNDGEITGWIGGSCAQPLVLREATRLLREGGDPYLLRLGTPTVGIAREHVRVFPMTCASGGTLDIYMEPHFPQPKLLLIGDSPVIVALGRLAQVVDFAIVQIEHVDFDPARVLLDERTYVLVASHGQYDEDVLEHVLRSPARYVGMVSSRRRAEACRDYLRASSLTEEQIGRLKAPAGLDLGAITPEEIAASILAELVQVRRKQDRRMQERGKPSPSHDDAGLEQAAAAENGAAEHTALVALGPEEGMEVDLVCGMQVEVATARHKLIHEGRDYYFCCPACKRLFATNPQEYIGKAEIRQETLNS